jgi:hypothetical protein
MRPPRASPDKKILHFYLSRYLPVTTLVGEGGPTVTAPGRSIPAYRIERHDREAKIGRSQWCGSSGLRMIEQTMLLPPR